MTDTTVELPARTWDSDRHPSPAEWLGWFESCSPAQRAVVAARVVENAELAHACTVGRHQTDPEEHVTVFMDTDDQTLRLEIRGSRFPQAADLARFAGSLTNMVPR